MLISALQGTQAGPRWQKCCTDGRELPRPHPQGLSCSYANGSQAVTFRRLRFIQRRKALGHTQEELAALLSVDRSTVLRWERAETEPQPWQRPKLASSLRVTAEELSELLAAVSEVPTRRDGYVLVSSVPLDFSLTTSHTVEVMEGFSAHDLVSRRQMLQQLSVLTSAALLQPIRQWVALLPIVPMAGEAVDGDELDELEQAVKVFRRWDASGSGGLKRKAVVGQLNAVAETLAEACDAATGRKLFQITAELAQLAGWMSYDQGLPGVAQRYYLLALHACRESGSNAALGAKVIGDMTQLSTAMGHYDDSLSLARSSAVAKLQMPPAQPKPVSKSGTRPATSQYPTGCTT
jgi:DNA-binding XRE family transcriptional regulator